MGASVGEDNLTSSRRVSFAVDIRPMFRASDRLAAMGTFDLWSYDDVVRHAAPIAERIAEGSLPAEGPLTNAQVSVFDRWVVEGAQP